MSALIHLLAESHRKRESGSFITRLARVMGQLSEPFWFALSLILFIAMGPFSVIAVLIGLHTLAKRESEKDFPEPANC